MKRLLFILMPVICVVTLVIDTHTLVAQKPVRLPIPDEVQVERLPEPTLLPEYVGSETPTPLELEVPTAEGNDSDDEILIRPLADSPIILNVGSQDSVRWPWWIRYQQQPMSLYAEDRELTLVDAFAIAIGQSPEFRVLDIDRNIARQSFAEENAKFDWIAFVSSQWDDRSNPVGSNLDGVQDRKRDEQYSGLGGVRRGNQRGGQFELSQGIGFQDSNSSFFNPRNQGTANLSLSYTQPLLRDGGSEVATASIRIARRQVISADADAQAAFQRRLLDVANAFWNLYRQRAQTLILWQSWKRADHLHEIMNKRKNLDVDRLQILSARGTASDRFSEYVNAKNEIYAAQESLLRLLYGDRYTEFAEQELVPIGLPLVHYTTLELDQLKQLALRSRPEVRSSIQQVHVASIECKVAKNQMLPGLGLTLAMSAAGLRGNTDIPQAWVDQFSEGEPTYGVGLAYDLPIGNRAASAAHRRAALTLRKRQLEFNTTVGDVALEVRNAGIRAASAVQIHEARAHAWRTTQQDMILTEKRFELLIDGTEVGRLYLDNLLSTQDRLAQSELSLLTAQIDSELQRLNLERSSGTLLDYDSTIESEIVEEAPQSEDE